MAGLCFTGRSKKIEKVLNSPVSIEPNGLNSNQKDFKWLAVWDTGASGSVITERVIRELGLKPVSVRKAIAVNSEYLSYCYYVNLTLPNMHTLQNLLVMQGELTGCDMLIGMDVISQGDFAVTNYNGKTTYSFRIPSCGDIDFVNNSYLKPAKAEVTPKPNDRCPCGSGKKYKQCCGK